MESVDRFLESPFNIVGLCVGVLVVVFVALNAKHSFYVLKSLRRNLLRTILTGMATMVLVLLVTLVWTILGALERVTEEKSKDLKAIVTEKWQIPSQMPMAYATRLSEGCPRNPKTDYRVGDDDSMTWSFYGGTIDPGKLTRENVVFFFCMEPKKLITIDDKGKIKSMMDGMDEFARSDLEKLDAACKEMTKDRRKVVIGKERLAAMNKKVGDRIKVTSINYKDIDLEFEIIGAFPAGRYDQSVIMNREYLESAMEDYKRKQGKAHDMANKTLNLVWLRVPDKKTYEKVAGQVESEYANANPSVKCETASSGVASFLDAYRDLLWGMKWLLVPAVMAAMALVIANAISISVRERRTEMAVMKVLGYSPNHIMLLVLGEALLIGAGCGLVSNLLSVTYLNYVKGGVAFPIAFFPSFKIPLAALWWGPAIGGLTAFAGSIVPAWSARSVKVSEVFAKIREPPTMGPFMDFVILHWRALVYGCLVGYALLIVTLPLVGKVPLGYSVRNLIVRWRTTLLTALAFTLVVALLTVMLAFVNGMYRLTGGSSQPGNVMVLSDGATDELFSNLGNGSDVRTIETRPNILRDEDGKPMASWEVYIVVNQPIENPQKGGRQRRFMQLRGLDDGVLAGKVHNLPLQEGGQWFSSAGVERPGGEEVVETVKFVEINAALRMALGDGVSLAKVKEETSAQAKGENRIQAVLGEGIARELGKDRGKASLAIGDTFTLGPRLWIVKGIMKSAGSTFDSEVWAKRDLVGPMFGKPNASTLVLRTESAAKGRETAEDLTKNFKDSAVQAQVESDYYDKLNATNAQFLVSIMFVTFIIGIGGVFGVMNTMFAAISQRIKDIGVLRIIGFAGWQVLISFFLESLFLALLGGILGCTLGLLANGWTATSIVGSGGGGGKSVVLKLVVDGGILAVGLLISLTMGTFGGLIPALFAMRVKPLESLR